MLYLSASTRQYLKYPSLFGCMFNTVRTTGRQTEALKRGCKFMVDNGVYSNKWEYTSWVKKLEGFVPYRDNCFGVIIPDFLHIVGKDNRGRNIVKGDYE